MDTRLRPPAVFLAATLFVAACSAAPAATPTPLPSATFTPAPTATLTPTPLPTANYTPTPQPQIQTPAWFANRILYEIFVRSYYDSNGDGIGDLAGVTAKLDYVQSLGATVIWMMPINPSPSYHGYDVTDYFAVNPDYGALDDMKVLLAAAHQRGIKVVMDLVVDHTSNLHPFFKDAWGNPSSKYADWYLWTNSAHTTYLYFDGNSGMPRLNHDNPQVVAYVQQVARFWMDLNGDGNYTDGVDGFRCDYAGGVPLTTWRSLREMMKGLNPNSFLLGEVDDYAALNLKNYYNNAFDAVFDFPLYEAMVGDPEVDGNGLIAGAQPAQPVIYTILGENKLFPPGYEIARFVNSHDTNRVMSEVKGNTSRAKAAAMLNLTLPGTPMIYYGEEIGMKGDKGPGTPYYDEYRREPMDWYTADAGPGMTTWFKDAARYNLPSDGISVQEEQGVAGSLLSLYQALVQMRGAHPALLNGAFAAATVTGSGEVLAYTRHVPGGPDGPEELFLVMLNFSDQAQQVSVQLNSAYTGSFLAVDALTGQTWPDLPAGQPYPAQLPAASGAVLQLNRK